MNARILFAMVVVAILGSNAAEAQWVSFTDETDSRLVLVSVPDNDAQEKDVAVGDFDRDGDEDVIVVRKLPFSNPGGQSDVLLMNESGVLRDRTFRYASFLQFGTTDARDVFVADLDGDEWLDIVIANTFHQQPRYLRNRGENAQQQWLGFADESSARFPFIQPPGQDPGPGPLFCALWINDVDNVNGPDIYFANYNPGGSFTVDYLLINDGNGFFTDESVARLGQYANVAFGPAAILEDFNNDNACDILKISTLFSVPPWNGLGAYMLYNDGTGNFTTGGFQEIPNDAPYMLAAGHLNNDDIMDIIVVGDNQDMSVLAQSIGGGGVVNYNGTFFTSSPRTDGFGGNIHLSDIDQDGDLDAGICPVDVDIANCSGPQAGEFTLVRNDGSGFFTDPYTTDQNFHIRPHDFEYLDLNGDGCDDMFMANCVGYQIFIKEDCTLVDVAEEGTVAAQPMLAVRPSPFSRETTVFSSLALSGTTGRARVQIFDVAGRMVRELWSGSAADAPASLTWDGRDTSGKRLTADVYFARLTVGETVEHVKIVLID